MRSGDQQFRQHAHAEHLTTLEAALSAAGWPVTADILPGRFHTDFISSPGIPEIYDLIAEIALDPGATR